MTAPTPGRDTGRSIVLIGFRGCGKSTVGRELAELVGRGHVDTDELIVERAGKSIAALFEEEGEARFRQREREIIALVTADRPAVISVGGGAVLDTRNTDLLCAAGKLVWLTAPVEVLWERIQADANTTDRRPALTGLSGLDEVEHLLAERRAFYGAAADLIIDTSDLTPGAVSAEIVRRLSAEADGS